jgi:hypothetical protein
MANDPAWLVGRIGVAGFPVPIAQDKMQKRHNLIKSSPIELKNFAHTYFGLFGWVVAFEKAALSCGFLKSSCEKVKKPLWFSSCGFLKRCYHLRAGSACHPLLSSSSAARGGTARSRGSRRLWRSR